LQGGIFGQAGKNIGSAYGSVAYGLSNLIQ
jgi:hypothetical protein